MRFLESIIGKGEAYFSKNTDGMSMCDEELRLLNPHCAFLQLSINLTLPHCTMAQSNKTLIV